MSSALDHDARSIKIHLFLNYIEFFVAERPIKYKFLNPYKMF